MSAGGGGGSMRQKGGYEGGQDESVSGGGGCSHRTRQLLLDDRTHGDSGPSVSGCSETRRADVCMYMCLSAVCCLLSVSDLPLVGLRCAPRSLAQGYVALVRARILCISM